MHGREKSDRATVANEGGEQSRVTGGGAGGAKGEDRGKRDRVPYARRAQNRRNAYERLIAAVKRVRSTRNQPES
jgi:hypothetical protein